MPEKPGPCHPVPAGEPAYIARRDQARSPLPDRCWSSQGTVLRKPMRPKLLRDCCVGEDGGSLERTAGQTIKSRICCPASRSSLQLSAISRSALRRETSGASDHPTNHLPSASDLYSSRNACDGSIRLARRAGRYDATAATTSRIADTPLNAIGSVLLTPTR